MAIKTVSKNNTLHQCAPPHDNKMYYAYDGNGNLLTEKFGSAVTPQAGNIQVTEEGGIYSTDYGFALTLKGPGGGSGSSGFERNYTWNERNLLKKSSDSQYTVEYRYGADGQRALKYAVSNVGISTESLYFNKMHQMNPIAGQELESKHIYVGETRIATKRMEAGSLHYGFEGEAQYFYHGDHLGSAQMVTDKEGRLYEHLEYTPYGELWVDRAVSAASSKGTPFRFSGKELDAETGLYYYGARYLDPKTSRWLSADPAMSQGDYIPGAPINDEAKKRNGNLPGGGGVFNVVNLHVYHYAGNNPVKYTDPDGRDVEVTANENGTYTVTGGTLNSDKNIYIMQDGERTGEVLGQTITENSFFNDEGNIVKGSVINPNDSSGQDFIDNLKSDNPNLLSYIPNARNNQKYDFKSRGDVKGENNDLNHYRGMPIKDANGNTVYGTARDVGNYGAGFVAGRKGLSWGVARFGFDAYQGSSESMTTQSAQRIGFDAGKSQRSQDRRR